MISRWPWVTSVAAAIIVLTPPAREIFYDAFISSERFLQDLAQMIYLGGVAIAILLAVIEWRVRVIIIRRRALAAAATGEQTIES
ncbi:MAG TPA: hypothetical protein VKX28_08125 [Xanthobacteraceae bacterium]|nr:hypothetical protein [Xanthobacteraceae bacterium]